MRLLLAILLLLTFTAKSQDDISARLSTTAWTNFKSTMTQPGENGYYTDVFYHSSGNDFVYDGDWAVVMSYPCFLENLVKYEVVSDSLFMAFEKDFYFYGTIRFSGDTMIMTVDHGTAVQLDYFLPREVDTATVDFLREHTYDPKCLVGEWTDGEGQIVSVSFHVEEHVPEDCYYPKSFTIGKDAVVIKDVIVFKGTMGYKIISVSSTGQFYEIKVQSELKGCRKGEVSFYQYVRPRG